jgi:hypothetical protein
MLKPTAKDQKAKREETQPPKQVEKVDEESEESFPASDPPSWTLGPDKDDG